MNPLKLAAGFLLPVLVVGGCHDGERPVADGPVPAAMDPAALPQVSYSSSDLADAMRVGAITRRIDGNGIVHLTVPVRNVSGQDFTIDYRFTWLDEARTPVDQPAGWQAFPTHAGTTGDVITADAPSPRAKDFQLDLRYAQ